MIRSRFRWALWLIALVLVLIPASLMAQESTGNDDSFILQVNRPVTVAAGDEVDVVVVVNDDVTIDGRVNDALIVIRGTATVRGEVGGNIYVYDGELTLEDGATVNDVTLGRSDLAQADNASITGDVEENADVRALGEAPNFFSVIFRIVAAIAVIIVSLIVMWLFGGHIQRAAGAISARPLESGVTGLATWVVLPLLAIIAFVTIIGIPVALGIVFILIPLLALMGHLVASYWVGNRLGGLANLRMNPYIVLIVGLVVLQVIGWIPWFGGLLVFIASMMGTGALVRYLWRSRRAPEPVTAGSGATV